MCRVRMLCAYLHHLCTLVPFRWLKRRWAPTVMHLPSLLMKGRGSRAAAATGDMPPTLIGALLATDDLKTSAPLKHERVASRIIAS